MLKAFQKVSGITSNEICWEKQVPKPECVYREHQVWMYFADLVLYWIYTELGHQNVCPCFSKLSFFMAKLIKGTIGATLFSYLLLILLKQKCVSLVIYLIVYADFLLLGVKLICCLSCMYIVYL